MCTGIQDIPTYPVLLTIVTPWGHPVKGADIAGLTGHFAFAVMRGTPKIWDLIAVRLGSPEIQR